MTPALGALGTATGQPELVAAAPMLKMAANKGVDALGDKYGFGVVGGKRGRKPMYVMGSALYPA